MSLSLSENLLYALSKRFIARTLCITAIILISTHTYAKPKSADTKTPNKTEQLEHSSRDIIDPSLDVKSTDLNPVNETDEQYHSRMQWWNEARFGMFIHWGAYAEAGKMRHQSKISLEEFNQHVKRFNPTKFDAEQWVQIAQDAGMKYMVLTTKHHDGFCMWDSKVSKYDIMDFAPFKRDPVQELALACKKKGMRFCVYYSIIDDYHPNGRGENFAQYRDEYMFPQIEELITGYKNIDLLWFDGSWLNEWKSADATKLYRSIREMRPSIIVNNRLSKGIKGMSGFCKAPNYVGLGDYGTPEREIPEEALPGIYWESCMTLGKNWGYRPGDKKYKSKEVLIHRLIELSSKGGNYLLNVGPDGTGIIPVGCVERLAEMGKWLKINGESVYNTSSSPFDKPTWGRYTQRDKIVYAHVLSWPEENKTIEAPIKDNKVSKAYLLADKNQTPLNVTKTQTGISIALPEKAPDAIASVVVICLEDKLTK